MANINIRIDNGVKKDAEKIFNELGMTATTAITLFYKQVIRTRSIPFEIKLDGTEDSKNLETAAESEGVQPTEGEE